MKLMSVRHSTLPPAIALWHSESMRQLHFIPLAVIGALGLLLFAYQLGSPAFIDYDEAAYARVVQETRAQGNILVPMIDGRPWFDKPPLYLWTLMGAEAFFHDTAGLPVEWALRLPGVAFGIASVLLAYGIIWECTRRRLPSFLGALVLATTPGFVDVVRQVRFDALLIVFTLLAAYAAARGSNPPRSHWLIGVGVATGLAAMTKSVMAVLPLLAAVSYLYSARSWDALRNRHLWIGLGAGFLIALPWHAFMTIFYGSEFWMSYLGVHVRDRYFENLFTNEATNSIYLAYLWDFGMPWSIVAAALSAASFALWKRLAPRERRILIGMAFTIFAVLLLFFTARTKVLHYIAPVFAFVAILAGYGFHLITNFFPCTWVRRVGAILMLIAAVYGALLAVTRGYHTEGTFAYEQELANEERAIAAILKARGVEEVYFTRETFWLTVEYYSGAQAMQLKEPRLPYALFYVVGAPNDPALPDGETLFAGNHLWLRKIIATEH